jgi:hypothetical protein
VFSLAKKDRNFARKGFWIIKRGIFKKGFVNGVVWKNGCD